MRRASFLIIAFAATLTGAARAQTPTSLTGKVVAVASGEAVTVLRDNGRRVTVRLSGVDAPAPNQRRGAQARRFLSDQTLSKPVRVVVRRSERNAIVGELLLVRRTRPSSPRPLPNAPIDSTGAQNDLPRAEAPSENDGAAGAASPNTGGASAAAAAVPTQGSVNEALVQAGWARWDRRDAPRDGVLRALEAEARAARRGIWAR